MIPSTWCGTKWIFYGHDLYNDYQIETLFSDKLIAVANLGFATRHDNKLGLVDDRSFIHTDWGSGFASSPDWETALLGARSVDRSLGLLVQSSSTALNFARHGFGVALIPTMMATHDLTASRIVKMELDPLELTQDYRLAYPKRLRSHSGVRLVVDALRSMQEDGGIEP